MNKGTSLVIESGQSSKQVAVKKNIRIDYAKYEVEEIAEIIADAILFPIYIGRVLLTVVVAFFLLFILISQEVTNYFILGVIFFIFSYIISLPSILIISMIRLIDTIRNDLNKIIEICIDTTKYIYEDSSLLKEQHKNGVPISSTFKDVFRGVALYVIRPSLKKVLAKRLKYLAMPFIFIIDQLFKYIIIKKQPKFIITQDESGIIKVDTKISLDDKIKKGSNKTTLITMRFLTIPLYVVLSIYGFLNILFVWLFAWIF